MSELEDQRRSCTVNQADAHADMQKKRREAERRRDGRRGRMSDYLEADFTWRMREEASGE